MLDEQCAALQLQTDTDDCQLKLFALSRVPPVIAVCLCSYFNNVDLI